MQEIVRRGKDSDVFTGLRLVNKHNGHMAIVTGATVTDYGSISWDVQKHTESFSLTWNARDIAKHWYLCTHEEYEQLLRLSSELAAPDAKLVEATGIIPIKKGKLEPQDAEHQHSDDCRICSDSIIYRWEYHYIKQDESYVDELKPVVVNFRLKLNSDDAGELTGYNTEKTEEE